MKKQRSCLFFFSMLLFSQLLLQYTFFFHNFVVFLFIVCFFFSSFSFDYHLALLELSKPFSCCFHGPFSLLRRQANEGMTYQANKRSDRTVMQIDYTYYTTAAFSQWITTDGMVIIMNNGFFCISFKTERVYLKIDDFFITSKPRVSK